jgi:D-glycero-D-manno-heptose 1,7-bisphosphate phosphatase
VGVFRGAGDSGTLNGAEYVAVLNRAVFLDRDGVINRPVIRNGLPFPPESVQDLEVLPGVPEALALLRAAGFRLVVVTNQPDVARGRQTRAEVEAIHASLTRTLPLDAVKVCYHDDADGCTCRKPLPGMLVQAAADMGLDLSRSYMVGDRWRDIEAGERAGTTTILIENEYPEKKPGKPAATVGSLREAAEWILAREKSVT